MTVQAIVVHGSRGVAKEYRPDGDRWLLVLHGPRGEEVGGAWEPADVLRDLMQAVYGDG